MANEQPLHLDMDAYLTFPERVRDEIQAWLRKIGGDPNHTFAFDLYKDRVSAYVYRTDENGHHIVTKDRNDVERTTVELDLTEPLPQVLAYWASVQSGGRYGE